MDNATDDRGTSRALRRTPLHDVHRQAGARMLPIAGYEMPLQYEGIIAEHTATRQSAGLFDVSHMGQLSVTAAGGADRAGVAAHLERLTPSNIAGLAPGRARYTVLTNEAGGVVDDVIITRLADGFRAVVNGARRAAVDDHLASYEDPSVSVRVLDRALLALQGPAAAAVLQDVAGLSLAELPYMAAMETEAFGAEALVTRCGYTGEDGFELSLPPETAAAAWQELVADPRVHPVGLGARDTLRLEAGLCLYGQDLNEETTPVEAGIAFVVGKRRAEEGGFLGETAIRGQLREGPTRLRVGLAVDGRVPVRAGALLRSTEGGEEAGIVTSGGVSPTLGRPIAMGFVSPRFAEVGTSLVAEVRGRAVPVTVTALPFVPARTKRRGS